MAIFPPYEGSLLIDRICSVENLTAAWRRVKRNIQLAQRSRSSGTDAVTIRDFEQDWATQMGTLAEELHNGSYRALPARLVAIPKKSGGERAISILAVRDRVAQRAVQQILEPLFDPLFLDCSYGCRPGVGVPEALQRVERYASQGLLMVVDADISSYFDTIDQRILMGLVRQRIDEVAVLHLISEWLSVGSLMASESNPADTPITPLEHGGALLQQAMDWAIGQTTNPPSSNFEDPYLSDSWERPGMRGQFGGLQQTGGLEQKFWAAAMFAKPALNGAKRLLPHIQKIGGKKLAIAAAIATGALAASEIAARAMAPARRGTPQGGALSPLLANIYLHPFDLAMRSQGMRMVRFMDDFVVMCADQAEAERALLFATRQLSVLRLNLNAEKSRLIAYSDGLDFLGQSLAPRQTGTRIEDGATSFSEAEQRLREAARQFRQSKKKG